MTLNDLASAQDPPDIQRLWAESEQLACLCADPHTALDEDGAMAMLCAAVRNVVGVDGACIVLREGELVHYAREDTIAPLWAGQKFPIGNCISGWSITHKTPVVIPDIYSDDRIPVEYYRKTYVKSLAMQPIEPSNPIGAIGVYWSHIHQATARELRLLEKLATVAAITLSHARLRVRLERVHAEAQGSLAAISHELRSYLNVILGWASVLRSKALDETALSHAVNVIERNAKAQRNLVDDLLDTTRIATGKLRLDLRLVDVGMVVREAIDAVRPLANSKNIRLNAVIAGPLHCRGDALRLQQIIYNLLMNAFKFSPEGGQVTVKVERNDEHAEVTIADSGKGISAEFMPYIFEPFRQVDDRHTMPDSGLGLGLSIARHLVEMHGGTIEALSGGIGQGATFTFRIPIL
jgi:signal transduction histidine kinase